MTDQSEEQVSIWRLFAAYGGAAVVLGIVAILLGMLGNVLIQLLL